MKNKKESVYDRVLRTRTIRCGYGIWDPGVMIDPNTQEVYGVFVDLTEELGRLLEMNIEWVMEVDWGQIPQALQSRKIDMMCAGAWASATRGTQVGHTQPLFYTTVDIVARADDLRFDNCIECINDENVTIAVGDGDISDKIAKKDFPKAQRYAKIQLAGDEINLMNVATKKADVFIGNRVHLKTFGENNPGKLRLVPMPRPIRVYGNVYGVDIHEQALLNMIDTAVSELLGQGSVDTALKEIREKNGMALFFPATRPYNYE